MHLHSFKNDYSEGCHPSILKALMSSNLEQEEGYGDDSYTKQAKALISEKTGVAGDGIFLIPIGTQTNMVVISSILKPYEYVIAAETGHIVYTEAGAIEGAGHKVVAIPTQADGKIRVADLRHYFEQMKDVHLMLEPRLLYISNATELGAVYTKADLEALATYCRPKGILIYMDGARLASALMSSQNDLTLNELAHYVDAFYLGGTKAGALLGEAVVLPRPELVRGFSMVMKQKGAVLAKGRLLGIQFAALFRDNLYFDLAAHANKMASRIGAALKARGYSFLTDSCTNQLFPILPNDAIAKLHQKYAFYEWKTITKDTSAIRLITCWATREEAVDELIRDIEAL